MNEHAVGRINASYGTFIIIFFEHGMDLHQFSELSSILTSAAESIMPADDVYDIVLLAWEQAPEKVELFGDTLGESIRSIPWRRLRHDYLIPASVTVSERNEVSFWSTRERSTPRQDSN